MKRQTRLAMIAALGVTGSLGLPAQAAGPEELCEKLKEDGFVFHVGQAENEEEIKALLDRLGIDSESFIWKDCPILTIPNLNCPETESPEPDIPGVDIPEPDIPDVIIPEVPGNSDSETSGSEAPIPDTEAKSYARQVVDLVNAERAKAGLSALTLDENLTSAALIRARESEISFSHTRPDGRSFSSVLSDLGISFRGAGENIAWGQKTPEEVMNGWMNSEGHRANILNANYTKIGVGYYQNTSGRTYWTQLFTY